MINIGTHIRKKIDEQQQTIVWFSKQLCCSRTNVYKILNKNSIDTNELIRMTMDVNWENVYRSREEINEAWTDIVANHLSTDE